MPTYNAVFATFLAVPLIQSPYSCNAVESIVIILMIGGIFCRTQAGVVVQLVLQSSGSFSVQIPANAIVVARVREDELSSTTAVSSLSRPSGRSSSHGTVLCRQVIGMLQRTCTLVSSAVMLSMVGAFGAQTSLAEGPFDCIHHQLVSSFRSYSI